MAHASVFGSCGLLPRVVRGGFQLSRSIFLSWSVCLELGRYMRRRPSTFCLQTLLVEEAQVTLNRMLAVVQSIFRALPAPNGCSPSRKQLLKIVFSPKGPHG